jgi:septum site-determining protein MinD
MTFTIAVHSAKGGTGKTSIAVNLAAAYALDGMKVCLLDMDMRGPSLCTYFKPDPDSVSFWVNDLLSGKRGINEIIYDVSGELRTRGKLSVGYSNPDINEIRELASKDRKWQSNALNNIIIGKKELTRNEIDVIIFDTGPGVEYESINAVAASETVLIVKNSTKACFECTEQLYNGVYKCLNKKCVIVNNMHHCSLDGKITEQENSEIPVLATIPCMCNIATRHDEILTLSDREHEFSRAIYAIKQKLECFH